MRGRVVMVLAAVLVAVVQAPAVAGGWWSHIDLDRSPIGVGESVTARDQVMFAGMDEAEAVRSGDVRYHAYLVRGVDRVALDEAMTQGEPEAWWSPPEELWHLAPVEFDEWDMNLASASATFVVPEVAPGPYGVMLCDLGCEQPLGNAIPTLDVPVHADAAQAQVARDVIAARAQAWERADALERRIEAVHTSVGSVGRDASTLLARVGTLERVTRELEAAVALGSSPEEPPATPLPGWVSVSGWLVAGAAGAYAVATRRRRVLEPSQADPVDADARGWELAGTR